MPTIVHSAHRPSVACEITQDRIIAARASDDRRALEMLTARTLAAGAVVPRLAESNVVSASSLQQSISDALAIVGGRSRDVIAIVPDAAVRISLLDFDSLPERPQEADAVVRFRLKKTLPFDVDNAALSYDARRSDGVVKVVAAIMLASVLGEYESVFRECGYNPGVVLPSTLAALGTVDMRAPTMVMKVDVATMTVAIVANENLLLFRSLENAGTTPDAARLAEDVYPSLVYFQDTYGMQVERILVGGLISADQTGSSLQEQIGVRVQDLVGSSVVTGDSSIPRSVTAAVVGALVS